MIQNCFTLFDRNSCLTFKLPTAFSTLNESVVIQLTFNSHNQINTPMEHFKNTIFIIKWKKKSYLVLNEGERNANRILSCSLAYTKTGPAMYRNTLDPARTLKNIRQQTNIRFEKQIMIVSQIFALKQKFPHFFHVLWLFSDMCSPFREL